MAIDDNIRDEKLQYYIIREAAKILALSSGRIDKYEYLLGEEILPSDQSRRLEQAKFTYSLLGKALEKLTKRNESNLIQKYKFGKKVSFGEISDPINFLQN